MIGVYNHLRNTRYLGSITILGRWIPSGRDLDAKLHLNSNTFIPPKINMPPAKGPFQREVSFEGTCYFLEGDNIVNTISAEHVNYQ